MHAPDQSVIRILFFQVIQQLVECVGSLLIDLPHRVFLCGVLPSPIEWRAIWTYTSPLSAYDRGIYSAASSSMPLKGFIERNSVYDRGMGMSIEWVIVRLRIEALSLRRS